MTRSRHENSADGFPGHPRLGELMHALIAFKVSNDAAMIGQVREAYERALEVTSEDERLELLTVVTGLVEERRLGVSALLPFVFVDYGHRIVSTATPNAAVRVEPSGDDELYGPRYLANPTWSFEDFGRPIAPRLVGLDEREQTPKVIRIVREGVGSVAATG